MFAVAGRDGAIRALDRVHAEEIVGLEWSRLIARAKKAH